MDYLLTYEGIRAVKPSVVFRVLEKMDEIIKKAHKKKSWEQRRFIVSFLFWTGLRASELPLTRRMDVDLVSRILYAPTLKKRKGVVRISITLKHVPTEELVFWERYLSKRGLRPEEAIVRMTRFGIRKAVKEAFEKFGYPGVTTHMLRHAIGIYLASNGWPINALARFLRHSNPRNTAIYYMITAKDLEVFAEELERRRRMGLEIVI